MSQSSEIYQNLIEQKNEYIEKLEEELEIKDKLDNMRRRTNQVLALCVVGSIVLGTAVYVFNERAKLEEEKESEDSEL